VRLARQADQVSADIPPATARSCRMALTEMLIQAGDFAAAEPVCAAALAACRDAGDLRNLPEALHQMVLLDLRAGRADELHRPGRTAARGRGAAGGAPAGDGDRGHTPGDCGLWSARLLFVSV